MNERFTSRWALLLAAIGMAIGTGNIWRFPRVAAQNGGAVFLIPWMLFLFLWSIPLLIVEVGMGKKTRMGTIGAFGTLNRKFTWMGGFVGFCTLSITFYYCVVTGWCFRYAVASLIDIVKPVAELPLGGLWQADSSAFWSSFSGSGLAVFFHFAAILFTTMIIARGVVNGIEKANKVLIPALFILLVIAAVRAVTLPGAEKGLNFLFEPDWKELLNHRVWLAGLSQSAWSTGAGWGLILTYAVYMREEGEIVTNSFLAGLGNNSASLLAAMAIIPTVFAVLPHSQALSTVSETGPASTGLTFIWIPRLFEHIQGGQLFLFIFFLALSVAAVSSLISMIELGTRIMIDFGLSRIRGVLIISAGCFLFGLPSALSMKFFQNQDWVWSVGLLLSGMFYAVTIISYGVEKFRREITASCRNDLGLTRIFNFIIKVVIPVEFAAMIIWWFTRAITVFDPDSWYHPFRTFSIGTCVMQWGLLIALLLIFNRAIRKRLFGNGRQLRIEKREEKVG
ncbi:MAG: sodium-dependent transporter [Candidatus Krumholzibacteriota bacterium]